MAQDFVETWRVPFPVYTDPSRVAYDLAGLHRRFGLGLSTVTSSLRAARAGFTQGRTQGDTWQQGGLLVVAPNGTLLFAHADESAGDHGDLDQALEAVRRYVSATQ